MDTLLDISDLRIAFGGSNGKERFLAVDGVNLQINRGESLVLLGESGSGKTLVACATMRLLPSAARVLSGTVNLGGNDLFTLPESKMRRIRGRRIAMIFQDPQSSLDPVISVGSQIDEALRCHVGLSRTERIERIESLLKSVGITESSRRRREYPHQFSGGQLQRIMLAIALAGEPDLLIADEPTTALDVTIQQQILVLLKRLQHKTGMAMLFITHDLGVTAQVADRIAVMRRGDIVETFPRDALLDGNRHEYTESLIAALPECVKRAAESELGTEAEADVLLEARGVKVYFPLRSGLLRRVVGYVKAVDGIEVVLREGQTLAMVGESGSGKSTTGRGLLGLLPITAGQVLYRGRDLAGLSRREWRELRGEVQIVFQDPYASMNPRMTVNEIIQEGIRVQNRLRGVVESTEVLERRVIDLLERVGLLAEHRLRYPHQFSGGQRQRICIARALAVRPRLVVFDEPTSSLDASVQAQILELLVDLRRDFKLTYLFITHNLGIVEYIAHEVAVMYQGKIVEHGEVRQVLGKPCHAYTQELLSAVPKISDGA